MIGMPAARSRADHHARLELADHAGELRARGGGVLDTGIRQFEIASHRHAEHGGRPCGLFSAQGSGAAGPHLALREVDDCRAMPAPGVLDEGAAAQQLDVVAVRADGQDVHRSGHTENLASHPVARRGPSAQIAA